MLPPPAIRGAFRTDTAPGPRTPRGPASTGFSPRPSAVPADRDDLIDPGALGAAEQSRTGLVPRGAGSAMGGGNVGEGVVVDLTGISLADSTSAPPSGSP